MYGESQLQCTIIIAISYNYVAYTVHLCFFFSFFLELIYIRYLGRGTKPMLTPYDGQCHIGLSGIRTYNHMHTIPELSHCDTGAHFFNTDITEIYSEAVLLNIYFSYLTVF